MKAKTRLNTPTKKRKFKKVMREFESGTLRHGSTGAVVHRPDVAAAIAYSEAKRYGSKEKTTRRHGTRIDTSESR